MELSDLKELYVEELKDLYSAEKQILKALPKMAKTAESSELRSAFEEHLQQTEGHVRRLEQIFERLGEKPGGKVCLGMQGVLEEGEEMISEKASPQVKDAGLISAAQRVEHYEIAGYGSVRTYAQTIGDNEAVGLLDQTLKEESQTDEKLTKIAVSTVNPSAAHQGMASAR